MAFSHQFSVFGETPSFKLCNTSEVPGGLKKILRTSNCKTEDLQLITTKKK